jgi:translocation protein SEC63
MAVNCYRLFPVDALQNPDPKAAAYFASYISKAYAALTDDVSRQNYEKYGHPDGPQVRPAQRALQAA